MNRCRPTAIGLYNLAVTIAACGVGGQWVSQPLKTKCHWPVAGRQRVLGVYAANESVSNVCVAESSQSMEDSLW